MTRRSKDQDLIDWLAAKMQEPDTEAAKTNGHTKLTPGPTPDDDVVIADCRGAKNAPKFEALFDRGDKSGHGGNDSAADFALLGILKFETQDPDQLERLMRRSALARPQGEHRLAQQRAVPLRGG